MREPIGDILIELLGIIFVSIWILGWLILLISVVLKKNLPKYESKLENFIQRTSRTLGVIQKYSLWGFLILLVLQIIASWLGWAESTQNGLIDE